MLRYFVYVLIFYLCRKSTILNHTMNRFKCRYENIESFCYWIYNWCFEKHLMIRQYFVVIFKKRIEENCRSKWIEFNAPMILPKFWHFQNHFCIDHPIFDDFFDDEFFENFHLKRKFAILDPSTKMNRIQCTDDTANIFQTEIFKIIFVLITLCITM